MKLQRIAQRLTDGSDAPPRIVENEHETSLMWPASRSESRLCQEIMQALASTPMTHTKTAAHCVTNARRR
jgi:hypothetical protein